MAFTEMLNTEEEGSGLWCRRNQGLLLIGALNVSYILSREVEEVI